MRRHWPALAGFACLALLVFSENLFGREFNRLFLLLPGIDKVLHVTEYFAVFVVIFRLTAGGARDLRRRAAIAATAGALLAVTDEFTQRLVADRNFELMDLAANMAGLTLAAVATIRPRWQVTLPTVVAALLTVGYVAHDTHQRLSDYATALEHERRYEFAEAREYYLRAVTKGIRTPAVYNELAWVSVEAKAGRPEDAVAYARMAYDAQPGDADTLDTYGWALHFAGRSSEALPYLEEAFRLKPTMFCIHYHLGEVYIALSRPELAEPHLRAQMSLTGTREAALAAQSLARLKKAVQPDPEMR